MVSRREFTNFFGIPKIPMELVSRGLTSVGECYVFLLPTKLSHLSMYSFAKIFCNSFNFISYSYKYALMGWSLTESLLSSLGHRYKVFLWMNFSFIWNAMKALNISLILVHSFPFLVFAFFSSLKCFLFFEYFSNFLIRIYFVAGSFFKIFYIFLFWKIFSFFSV